MATSFDRIVAGGEVVDGSGDRPRFRADVGIVDGRIAAIGDLGDAETVERIDATGALVAPGFIDAHVHSEAAFLLGDPDRFGSSLQGVTTHLTAADGFGWARLPRHHARSLWRLSESIYGQPDGFEPYWPTISAYKAAFAGRLPVNLALQVPHHAVRAEVMGLEQRVATDEELAAMVSVTEAWMDEGAVGIGLGLDYIPGGFSDERELEALATVVARRGGALQAHARFTELGLEGAWEEMLRVGRATGIRVNVSHSTFDEAVLELIAREAVNVDLANDTYLYPAGCTHLLYAIPTVHQQDLDKFLDGLKDPRRRAQAQAHFDRSMAQPGREARMTIGASRSGRFDGWTLADLAAKWGVRPARAALDLVEQESGDVLIVYGQNVPDEQFSEQIRMTLEFDHAMIASDGIYRGKRTHPRGFGAFVRVLGRFARDENMLSIEQAVHRMSGLPAERYGIRSRGLVAEGLAADLVVFDPTTVNDAATWLEPRLEPVGVRYVLVNGVTVVDHGVLTGAEPGVVIE